MLILSLHPPLSHLMTPRWPDLSPIILLLLLCLIADLNISQVILIISIDCSGDSIRHTLLDPSLISTNKLILGGIVLEMVLILLVEGVPTHLNLSAIYSNVGTMGTTTTFLRFRLLSSQLRGVVHWGIKDVAVIHSWEHTQLLLRTVSRHGPLSELPPGYPLSHSRCLQVIKTHPLVSLLNFLWLTHGNQTFWERVLIYIVLIVKFWLRVTTLALTWEEAYLVQWKVILIHLHQEGVCFQVSVYGVVQNNWILNQRRLLHGVCRLHWGRIHMIHWSSDWGYGGVLLLLLLPVLIRGLWSIILNDVSSGHSKLVLLLSFPLLTFPLALWCINNVLSTIWWVLFVFRS